MYHEQGSKTRAVWEDLRSRRSSVFMQHVVQQCNSLLQAIVDGRRSRRNGQTHKSKICEEDWLLRYYLRCAWARQSWRGTGLCWDRHQSSKDTALLPAWDSSAKMRRQTHISTSKHQWFWHSLKQLISVLIGMLKRSTFTASVRFCTLWKKGLLLWLKQFKD